MVFNLSDQNSIANQFLADLRDKTRQQDRYRFRKNMQQLGAIIAYEISKKLTYTKKIVETPLGKAELQVLERPPVLITVLRAGIPYFQGFLDFFEYADCGFIGAYRKEGEDEITINLDYLATPSLQGREVILVDPMLATGRSFVRCIKALTKNGEPRHLHLAALVSAPEGIRYIEENLEVPHSIWTVAIDERLNDKFYIVPGLGDAGDLSFGEKLNS